MNSGENFDEAAAEGGKRVSIFGNAAPREHGAASK